MPKYSHHRFNYHDIEAICVIDIDTTLPTLHSLLWLALSRLKVSRSCQEADMTAVAYFYEFLNNKYSKTLEELLKEIGLRRLASELPGFSAWMNAGRKPTDSYSLLSNTPNISPKTHDTGLKFPKRVEI